MSEMQEFVDELFGRALPTQPEPVDENDPDHEMRTFLRRFFHTTD